ncbi:patatin-like phospholipase family protein [Corallococcus sp. M34]|uniref:patatin-like phospholipase family protein n=1 Tax=Citreicoccus inhibens TaxID=2849499 RepID=UPI001C216D26|nr:patatin-like phospholipase family protein [Citreicoccus inhibens]MBU8898213.1 patatin-like phospholipase family protein [Citreicoccus inhibens]
MTDTPTEPQGHGPLGPLALSLSGGGYRAATYHLGTLRFLHRVGLLGDVVGLSTVSGGTLTGLAWVSSQLDGKSFPEFSEKYGAYLKRTNVIGEALAQLTLQREATSHDWASLIRSAATVYARDDLFGDRRLGEVMDARGLSLNEAIFNSTEFSSGLDFRFRRSANTNIVHGNNRFPMPLAVARQVRLADIAAASSCFPGGFEPFVFPDQFHWPTALPLDEARKQLGERFAKGLPLMDGGIYDNQGIDSLLLAFESSSHVKLLISDVSVENGPIYSVPPNPTSRGWVTLRAASWMGWALFILSIVSALILAVSGISAARAPGWTLRDAFLYLIPGLLTASVATALGWIRRRLLDVFTLVREHVDVNAWPPFRELTVLEFAQMAVLRVSSMVALTSGVFMKRVRGLIFDRVYKDPDYQGRRMSNLIADLTRNRPELFSAHPWMRPQEHLVTLAQQACAMPTTLWFTQASQFDMLVTAGEATTCFTLLRHLLADHADACEKPGTALHDLYTRLRAQWTTFNQAPSPVPEQPRVAA